MKIRRRISIANEFSKEPLGRFPDDSDASGTAFRDLLLAPTLENFDGIIEIDLDGTEGYGSSFLEEAFGGIIRNYNFRADTLLDRIALISNEDPTLIEEITQYINDADAIKKLKN